MVSILVKTGDFRRFLRRQSRRRGGGTGDFALDSQNIGKNWAGMQKISSVPDRKSTFCNHFVFRLHPHVTHRSCVLNRPYFETNFSWGFWYQARKQPARNLLLFTVSSATLCARCTVPSLQKLVQIVTKRE